MDYLSALSDPGRDLVCVELFAGKQTLVKSFRFLAEVFQAYKILQIKKYDSESGLKFLPCVCHTAKIIQGFRGMKSQLAINIYQFKFIYVRCNVEKSAWLKKSCTSPSQARL